VTVRRIRSNEATRLRTLQLAALADAPSAFAASLADEEAEPPSYWEDFAQKAATDETLAFFIAEEAPHWLGIVGTFIPKDQQDIARLIAMWVHPNRRRSGIGAALVEAVIAWARSRSVTQVHLWVTDTNQQARSLYVRDGFAETGLTRPLPSNPALQEMLMVRDV